MKLRMKNPLLGKVILAKVISITSFLNCNIKDENDRENIGASTGFSHVFDC